MANIKKILLFGCISNAFMMPPFSGMQKPVNKKPAYSLILKAWKNNLHVIIPSFLGVFLINALSSGYFSALQSYSNEVYGSQMSEKEASNLANLSFMQFVPILTMLLNNFITDWANEGIARYMLDNDNIVNLLSKKGNFYNEHGHSEIAAAISQLPQDVVHCMGIISSVFMTVLSMIISHLVRASPARFVKAFGIAESSNQDIKGQDSYSIATDMVLVILTGVFQVIMPMLLQSKGWSDPLAGHIDDVLSNVNAIQALNMQKSEAKHIKEVLSKQYGKQKFDNLKMFASFIMPYFPLVLWGLIMSKLAKTGKEKHAIGSRMNNNIVTLATLSNIMSQISMISWQANSIATKLELINAGVTQDNKGKITVRLNHPQIKINMPKGFKYPVAQKHLGVSKMVKVT